MIRFEFFKVVFAKESFTVCSVDLERFRHSICMGFSVRGGNVILFAFVDSGHAKVF